MDYLYFRDLLFAHLSRVHMLVGDADKHNQDCERDA